MLGGQLGGGRVALDVASLKGLSCRHGLHVRARAADALRDFQPLSYRRHAADGAAMGPRAGGLQWPSAAAAGQ